MTLIVLPSASAAVATAPALRRQPVKITGPSSAAALMMVAPLGEGSTRQVPAGRSASEAGDSE